MRWVWPVALMAVITLSSAGPGPRLRGIDHLFGYDKVGHFAVFGLLATLWLRARPATWKEQRWLVSAAGLAASFGVVDELHQSFNPTRSFDLADMAANALGAIVAIAAYRLWGSYRGVLEHRLWPKRPATVS